MRLAELEKFWYKAGLMMVIFITLFALFLNSINSNNQIKSVIKQRDDCLKELVHKNKQTVLIQETIKELGVSEEEASDILSFFTESAKLIKLFQKIAGNNGRVE